MSRQQTKVTPPTCHVIETCQLNVGDHIYRRLNGIKALVGYHHGIVTEVNEAYNNDNDIKVIEMRSSHGIQINTLTNFLNGDKCRLVYYNTSKFYQTLHASGTCHIEQSSPIQEIKQRIKECESIILSFNKEIVNPNIYALLGANCEEFAVWIKTGLYKGVKMSQLKCAERRLSCTVQSGEQIATSAFSYAMNYVDDVAMAVVTSSKSAVKSTANTMSKTVASEVVENTAKFTARGIGCGIGVAVAIEAVLSGYKIWKYKNDYKYTKCDLWRDLGRSWIVTGICTGIGVALLPIGWWAILPAAAIGLLINWLFQRFNVFDKKSHKEKVYKEYKLNTKSSVKDLKSVRRKIIKQIMNEKLHPDKWPSNLDDKEKPKRLEKYLWLTAIIELLDKDIQNGSVTFENDKKKSNHLKQIEYK